MAVTATAGEILETNTTSSTYVTGSNSITSGDLIVAFIYSEGGTLGAPTSVVGTNGFSATYTQIAGRDDGVIQMYAFRAVASSGVAGTITFTFSDDRVDGIVYGFVTQQNVNQTANQGVVQAVYEDALGNTSGTVTLATFADPQNATLGIFCHKVHANDFTPGTGFTQVDENQGTVTGSGFVEFRDDNQTGVDCSWAVSNARTIGIAVELDGTPTGPGPGDVTFVDGATGTSVTATVSIAKADLTGLADGDTVVVHLGAHVSDATGWALAGWTQADLKNTS